MSFASDAQVLCMWCRQVTFCSGSVAICSETGNEGGHTTQWSSADIWSIQGLQQASAAVLETAGQGLCGRWHCGHQERQ